MKKLLKICLLFIAFVVTGCGMENSISEIISNDPQSITSVENSELSTPISEDTSEEISEDEIVTTDKYISLPFVPGE